MRLQKRTIQITFVITIISCLLYAILIFAWIPQADSLQDRTKTYFSNITVGIVGSAIVTLFVSLISYFREERSTMERFVRKHRDLYDCASRYHIDETPQEKIAWLAVFDQRVMELFDVWAEVDFLIDPMHHRDYLKDICDFYNAVSLLTFDDASFFDRAGTIPPGFITKLDKIIIEIQTETEGITKYTYRRNRLTTRLHQDMQNMDALYHDRSKVFFKKFTFSETVVRQEVFQTLTDKTEEELRKVLQEIDRTSLTEVKVHVSKDAVDELNRKQYLSTAMKLPNGIYQLSCLFVLVHYFELKAQMR